MQSGRAATGHSIVERVASPRDASTSVVSDECASFPHGQERWAFQGRGNVGRHLLAILKQRSLIPALPRSGPAMSSHSASSGTGPVTQLLDAICHGRARADDLLPYVYDELRKLAAQRLHEEKPGQTLQPTALVHEAYLRLVGDGEHSGWDSRGHFFAAAAEAMRRILVDQARRKGACVMGETCSESSCCSAMRLLTRILTNCWLSTKPSPRLRLLIMTKHGS